MKYDMQTYRAVFSAFTTIDCGLKVGDVILPNHLMRHLSWTPDMIHEVLDAMVAEGFLTQEGGETKSPLGRLGNGWYLTKEGFALYTQLC